MPDYEFLQVNINCELFTASGQEIINEVLKSGEKDLQTIGSIILSESLPVQSVLFSTLAGFAAFCDSGF